MEGHNSVHAHVFLYVYFGVSSLIDFFFFLGCFVFEQSKHYLFTSSLPGAFVRKPGCCAPNGTPELQQVHDFDGNMCVHNLIARLLKFSMAGRYITVSRKTVAKHFHSTKAPKTEDLSLNIQCVQMKSRNIFVLKRLVA